MENPRLPDEALKHAIDYCLQNEFACVEMGDDNVYCFIMAKKKFSPDQAGIIVAHIILHGIMTGSLTQSNLVAMYPEGYKIPN